MKWLIVFSVLVMSGCATKGDIRYLENRITKGFNFIDSQITNNEEGIKFLAKEMERNHPYPRKPTDKCYSLCRNKFEESGVDARKQTNEEFIKAIRILTEDK